MIDNTEKIYRSVNDYKVEMTISVSVPAFRMPKKKYKVFFKQPNKVKIKSRGFGILPRTGMFTSPIENFNNLTDIKITKDSKKLGKDKIMMVGNVIVDNDPPAVVSANVSGANLIDITFNESVSVTALDINNYDLIFAGAQKNLGIAGLTIVIINNKLLYETNNELLPMFDYSAHAEESSMLNTSPVFSWYVSGLVFDWIHDQGGLEMMAKINQEKSSLLYNYLDQSSFYSNPVSKPYRSWMNIPFILTRDDLDKQFIQSAEEEGLFNLKGHRTVGGMRASVYNAMPIEGIKKLITFMDYFAKLHE